MPPASSVSPAPMSLFSPNRLSTPTIKKFSSPNCAFGSRMSRDPRSSAETLLSMLFFDDCHCQAPPVSASADTAIRAAAARPATIVLLRRPRRGSGCAVLRPRTDARRLHPVAPAQRRQIRHFGGIPCDDGDNLGVRIFRVGAHRRDDLGGRCRRCGGAGGGTRGSGSGRGRLSSSGTLEAPCTFAIRSATVTPSVWLPVCAAFSTSSESELPLRSHGAAPGDGRGLRVSH